jgi:dihydrofolate synthase/folylpolyglutamate synthase
MEILGDLEAFNRLLPAGGLTTEAIRYGLEQIRTLTRFQGRWQIIGRRPTILCDSAHNEAGIRMAFEKIKQAHDATASGLHIVTGFVNDKDVGKVLPFYPKEARYYFAKADIPRGMPAAELKEKAAEFGLEGKAYASVRNALKAARRAAGPDDLIVVIGSIFVVAEVI